MDAVGSLVMVSAHATCLGFAVVLSGKALFPWKRSVAGSRLLYLVPSLQVKTF